MGCCPVVCPSGPGTGALSPAALETKAPPVKYISSNISQAGLSQLKLFCKFFSFMATLRGRKSKGKKDRWFCCRPDGIWTSISVLSSSSQNHLGWHPSELTLNRLWISRNMKFSVESLISSRIETLAGYTHLQQFLNPTTGFILKWIRNLTPLNNTRQP